MPSLACIADDYTGAAELASSLQRVGLRTVLLFGAPGPEQPCPPCDAVIVALKSRTLPVQDAVSLTLQVNTWLQAHGVRQLFFKYCSTFDSTPGGNIGPVASALDSVYGSSTVVFCPATPEQGRTVYQGHLFVYNRLLSDTPMRHHPLTPMKKSNVVTLLQEQVDVGVGQVTYQTIATGSEAVGGHFGRLLEQDTRFVVADALDDEDLDVLAQACREHRLVTGAVGLARALGRLHVTTDQRSAVTVPHHSGPTVVLAGSCSQRTLEQIAWMSQTYPSLKIDAHAVAQGHDVLDDAVDWAQNHLARGPALIYSSATPAELEQLKATHPDTDVAGALEQVMGNLAGRLVELGIRRIVVAGGETTGAVLESLGIDAVDVGPELDPGVPWVITRAEPKLAVLPKAGNFGLEDMFVRAVEVA